MGRKKGCIKEDGNPFEETRLPFTRVRNSVPRKPGRLIVPKAASVAPFVKGLGSFTTKTVKANQRRRAMQRAPLKVKGKPDQEPSLEEKPLLRGGIEGVVATVMGAGWRLALKDDFLRCFVSYREGAFPPMVTKQWWNQLESDIQWNQPVVGERVLPRSAAWLTKKGCKCVYRYGQMQWPAQPMEDWFLALTDKVCKACGLKDRPNSCNANYYQDGSQQVGWHTDDEPLFDGTHRDTLIVSLSLGTKRTFELSNNYSKSVTQIGLKDGDICTMEGMLQKHYKHRVPIQKGVQGGRINLTWRWITAHDADCPAGNEQGSPSPVPARKKVPEPPEPPAKPAKPSARSVPSPPPPLPPRKKRRRFDDGDARAHRDADRLPEPPPAPVHIKHKDESKKRSQEVANFKTALGSLGDVAERPTDFRAARMKDARPRRKETLDSAFDTRLRARRPRPREELREHPASARDEGHREVGRDHGSDRHVDRELRDHPASARDEGHRDVGRDYGSGRNFDRDRAQQRERVFDQGRERDCDLDRERDRKRQEHPEDKLCDRNARRDHLSGREQQCDDERHAKQRARERAAREHVDDRCDRGNDRDERRELFDDCRRVAREHVERVTREHEERVARERLEDRSDRANDRDERDAAQDAAHSRSARYGHGSERERDSHIERCERQQPSRKQDGRDRLEARFDGDDDRGRRRGEDTLDKLSDRAERLFSDRSERLLSDRTERRDQVSKCERDDHRERHSRQNLPEESGLSNRSGRQLEHERVPEKRVERENGLSSIYSKRIERDPVDDRRRYDRERDQESKIDAEYVQNYRNSRRAPEHDPSIERPRRREERDRSRLDLPSDMKEGEPRSQLAITDVRDGLGSQDRERRSQLAIADMEVGLRNRDRERRPLLAITDKRDQQDRRSERGSQCEPDVEIRRARRLARVDRPCEQDVSGRLAERSISRRRPHRLREPQRDQIDFAEEPRSPQLEPRSRPMEPRAPHVEPSSPRVYQDDNNGLQQSSSSRRVDRERSRSHSQGVPERGYNGRKRRQDNSGDWAAPMHRRGAPPERANHEEQARKRNGDYREPVPDVSRDDKGIAHFDRNARRPVRGDSAETQPTREHHREDRDMQQDRHQDRPIQEDVNHVASHRSQRKREMQDHRVFDKQGEKQNDSKRDDGPREVMSRSVHIVDYDEPRTREKRATAAGKDRPEEIRTQPSEEEDRRLRAEELERRRRRQQRFGMAEPSRSQGERSPDRTPRHPAPPEPPRQKHPTPPPPPSRDTGRQHSRHQDSRHQEEERRDKRPDRIAAEDI